MVCAMNNRNNLVRSQSAHLVRKRQDIEIGRVGRANLYQAEEPQSASKHPILCIREYFQLLAYISYIF